MTGVEAGEEKSWTPRQEETGAGKWKAFFSRKGSTDKVERSQDSYRDKTGHKPAFATIGITWVEQGWWQGRKAHFVRLHAEHHHGEGRWIQRVELAIRVWKAGDAIKSIAHRPNEPISSFMPPAALDLAAGAPEIVLYGPRAAVGREAGTPVDCFWDGHFQPGDRWHYFAEARAPQHLAFVAPKAEDVWSMLRILSYGDYKLKEPAPDFDLGMIVLSDGEPFELTAYSSSTHQHGGLEVEQYLWSPYNPVRINHRTRLVPKGQKRIGSIKFESEAMKAKLKELVSWSRNYDTVSSFMHPRR